MGNDCCQKPEEEFALNTIDSDGKEKKIKKDKYPHDSDSAFRKKKKGDEGFEIKPLSNENIIVRSIVQ